MRAGSYMTDSVGLASKTCTQTFKTTLATLRSRPSHLAQFLAALFFRPHHESMASVYSAESDDLSTYRRHLTSQGLLPHTANIHVFLDRASAPCVFSLLPFNFTLIF